MSENDSDAGFQIRQRSLDGGRPTGQLSLDGGVVPDENEEDDE